MMRNHISTYGRFAILLCVLVTLLVPQGCATMKSSRRREKLSEAMEKASDDYSSERTVSRPEKISFDDDDDDDDHLAGPPIKKKQTPSTASKDAERKKSERTSSASDKSLFLGFTGGSGSISGDDFQGMYDLNVLLGSTLSDGRTSVELFGGYGWAPLEKSSDLYDSINKRVHLLKAGLQTKIFMTPPHTALSPYLQLGAAYNWMFWDYRNDLSDGREHISSDSIDGLEIYTGVGAMLRQEQSLRISVEILPGVGFWGGSTAEGFENDVFDPFWSLKFRFTVSFFP